MMKADDRAYEAVSVDDNIVKPVRVEAVVPQQQRRFPAVCVTVVALMMVIGFMIDDGQPHHDHPHNHLRSFHSPPTIIASSGPENADLEAVDETYLKVTTIMDTITDHTTVHTDITTVHTDITTAHTDITTVHMDMMVLQVHQESGVLLLLLLQAHQESGVLDLKDLLTDPRLEWDQA
jgi:hypothetical protein